MNMILNSYTIIYIQYFYTYEYMDTLIVYIHILILCIDIDYIYTVYIYISILYTGITFLCYIIWWVIQWGYPNSWMVDFIENPSRNG